MKTFIPFVFAFLFLSYFSTINGQNVGVGTNTPEASAKLHIEDANSGVLIPRVSLTDVADGTSPVNQPATSLMVYNTNASVTGGAGEGFYYWDGNKWMKLIDSTPAQDWYEANTNIVPDDVNDNIYTLGRVGINTDNPSSQFHVAGDYDGAIDSAFMINNYGRVALGDNIFEGLLNITTQTSESGLNNYNAANRPHIVLRDRIGGDRSYITGFDSGLLMGANWSNFSAAAGSNSLPNADIFLSGNGQLGLGTFTPSSKLHIASTAANITLQDLNATINSSGHTNGIFLNDKDETITGFLGFDTTAELLSIQNRNDDGEIAFRAGGNIERMRIDNIGRVGIGTNNPVKTLQVSGTSHVSSISSWGSVNSPILQLNRGAGNVGVAADIFFHAQGSLAAEGNMFFLIDADNTAVTDGFYFAKDSETSTGRTDLMVIKDDGTIGMGLTSPSHPLHLSSGAHVTAAGVWTNASDVRLKTNIETSKYGLKEVLNLRSVDYAMKKGGTPQVGFLAQEVQAIIPEVVSGFPGAVEAGETLGIAYGQLVPVLTKAIQEQQQIIDDLTAEMQSKDAAMLQLIQQLQTEIEELKEDK